jgi:hypothetical protein
MTWKSRLLSALKWLGLTTIEALVKKYTDKPRR